MSETLATATVTAAGMTVQVVIETDDLGLPRLVLLPQNCRLEGDMPGRYYLIADE